jgi:hypothetical protein
MTHAPRILVTAAAVVLLAAGCGDADTTPAGEPSSTDAPTTTVDPDDTLGGFGPPVATAAEFDLTATWAIAGTADLDERGCWWVVGDGDRGLLLAPTGTELGDTGDTLVGPDGTVFADGERLDIDGVVLYGVGALPGGADGKWGNYLAFCGPDRPVVIAKTLTIAVETDVEAAAAQLASVGAQLFDTDHGCGYGFATGSADDRWALHLDTTGSETINSGTFILPDERFGAYVAVGQHLFANHCDDVDEWFEPDQIVAARWPIIAGSFDYPGNDGTGSCTQGSVTTTLSDSVVDIDGTLVELGPITIDNDSFGCFAG